MTHSPATYDDLLHAPKDQTAELIAGELFLTPRPSLEHGTAASELVAQLIPAFRRKLGTHRESGWRFIVEPELHLGGEGGDVLVPDIAGWQTMDLEPGALQGAHTSQVPTWVCEVLSPSTMRYDRAVKREAYRKHGVAYLWLVDPMAKLVEVYGVSADVSGWVLRGTYAGEGLMAAEPFMLLSIDLGLLWDTGEGA